MIKKLSVFTGLLLGAFMYAEAANISLNNIHQIKADQLTDTQVSDFVTKYTNAGYTLADVERMAHAKKMPAAEWEKLKNRINEAESQASSLKEVADADKKIRETEISENISEHTNRDNRIFGSALFNNGKVSFVPSQSVATPRNYRVGPSDELHIDVFGMAEATYDLTVSKEGSIRIPNAGVAQVSGLTIEEAENVIKKKLSSIYNSISSGRTSVTLSLSKIRSIKVFIMGEVATPGSYTISSVSSVFNALSACGGPSKNGTMRNIKVIRAGKEIATVDLYDFFINGTSPDNTSLQDQDVIQVSTYENRVTVNGEVKREGIYELKKGENLNDLLKYCGGFTDEAYTDRISVTRSTNGEKSVADVSKELFGMFAPASGDVYQISKMLDKYSNRVQILGNVFRPGVYALEEKMTLKDLVTKANGLTEDAFMESATVVRLQEDLTPEIVSFNVKDLMEGRFNLELRKEDVVTIGGKNDFDYKKSIAVYGRVLAPGVFPYYENATLRDILFLTKGFEENANTDKIEVVRRVTDTETLKSSDQKAEVFVLSVDRELNGADADFKLMPNDQITVRIKEGYEQLGTIQITGESKQPGVYAITNKNEKISDVIARAGGLTKFAYPQGAFLIRSANRTEAEKRRDMKIIEMLNNAEDETTLKRIKEEINARQDLVGIRLDKIIKRPGDEDTDLKVKDGDLIYIPQEMQTITVAGSVQVPGKEVFKNKGLRKYIKGAGGFTSNAKKSSVYVAYPNGRIASTKHILWMKNYPEVKPGSHIYVPEKLDKSSDNKEKTAFLVTVMSSVVSMSSVVVTAISVTKKK